MSRIGWGELKGRTVRALVWLVQARRVQAIVFLSALSVALLALSLIVHLPEVNDVDRQVTQAIQANSGDVLTFLAKTLTYLGNTITLILVAVIAALIHARQHRPRAAAFSIAMLIGLPLSELMKWLVGRPRPEEGIVNVILPAVGLSFPSGHALASTAVYGFFAVVSWLFIQRRALRIGLTLFFSLLVLGIGGSRIYLGVHWFSDVVGGFTAGLILLTLVVIWYRRVGEEAAAT